MTESAVTDQGLVPHTEGVGTALLVLALLAGGLGAVRLRRGAARPDTGTAAAASAVTAATPAPTPGRADPGADETIDLDAAFDRVLADHAHELGELLQLRLRNLVDRQVPVRGIRPAPGSHTARVCFADGTVVLARSASHGDLVLLVRGMHLGSVRLAGFSREGQVTRLDLRWRTGQRVALLAVGLDQPD